MLENLAAENDDKNPQIKIKNKEPQKETDDFDSILDSFTDRSEPSQSIESNNTPSVRVFGGKEIEAFVALLQSQVESNWNAVLGAGHGGTKISVKVQFKPNGEIVRIKPIKEYSRYKDVGGSSQLKATNDPDVIMANLNDNVKAALFAASPIKGLEKFLDFYNEWRNIEFMFTIPD